jgi:hypothetical protein
VLVDTPLVPDDLFGKNHRADESETTDDRHRTADTGETDAPGSDSGSGLPVEQRFTRHRAGDTVVLYDRLEQTTWVQADYDPADLV